MSANIMRLETLAHQLASQAIEESQAEYLYGKGSVEEAKLLIQRRHYQQTVY